jgi:hypothetical protein
MARNCWWVTALAASALVGCSGGGGESPAGQSTLSVSLMDAPVDGVSAVYVRITGLWLKREGNGPAVELPLASGPRTVDLLALTDQNAAILVDDAPIEPGRYEWLAMDVSAEHDGSYNSYVVTEAGGHVQLRVPSGRVRLVGGFEVEANQATELLFDWNVRQGLVAPPGLPGYVLKPAFRMLDVTEYGVLRGTVDFNKVADPVNACGSDHTNLDVGNVVYVFAGANTTLDDYDGTDDPVASAEVLSVAGVYSYRVLLGPGDYTVAFTCQAASDVDPEADETLVFWTPPVTVTMAGDTRIVDF